MTAVVDRGAGGAERHEQREAAEDDRERGVGVAHDGALRPDDRDRGRGVVLRRAARAREVPRRVADLDGGGTTTARVLPNSAGVSPTFAPLGAEGDWLSVGMASAAVGPATLTDSAARTAVT